MTETNDRGYGYTCPVLDSANLWVHPFDSLFFRSWKLVNSVISSCPSLSCQKHNFLEVLRTRPVCQVKHVWNQIKYSTRKQFCFTKIARANRVKPTTSIFHAAFFPVPMNWALTAESMHRIVMKWLHTTCDDRLLRGTHTRVASAPPPCSHRAVSTPARPSNLVVHVDVFCGIRSLRLCYFGPVL